MLKGKVLVVALLVSVTVFGVVAFDRYGVAQLHAGDDTRYDELQLFADVLAIVRRSYVEEVPMKELLYGAISGMLATLDPHSSFMPPDVYREMKIDTSGEFGGLGIEITIRDGLLTVVSPIEDTPAGRAGLEAGDQILKIGEQYTKEMDITEAVKLMRGPQGSTVSLFVMRESFEKPREFKLVRETIKIRSCKGKILEAGIAHVRLTQFQESTSAELEEILRKLKQEAGGELKGVILDLRNNPGGLLDQAVKIADLFLPSGLIVYTEGREEGSQLKFAAHQVGTEPAYPMVVLINGGSASASEIVAGALQDHRRAIILGVQSFGKGSVQTIIPLRDDSGLRLTTARYFTPNGRSIQAQGIVPDLVVPQLEVKGGTPERMFREKDLRNHFEHPGGKGGKTSHPAPPREATPDEKAEDYQLLRALDLMKGWNILDSAKRPAA